MIGFCNSIVFGYVSTARDVNIIERASNFDELKFHFAEEERKFGQRITNFHERIGYVMGVAEYYTLNLKESLKAGIKYRHLLEVKRLSQKL